MLDRTPSTDAAETQRLAVGLTGGLTILAVCIAVCALLERLGFPTAVIALAAMALVLGTIVVAAFAGRSMTVFAFDLARQAVPIPANVLALTTVAMALLWSSPEPGLAGSAVAAGLVVAAVVFAPAWRRSGAASIAGMMWAQGRDADAALTISLLTLTMCASAAAAATALCAEANGWVAQALGVSARSAAGVSAVVMAAATVLGGLSSVGTAQLAAAGCAVVAALAGTALWAAGTPPAPSDAAAPRGDQVWLWLAACCGTIMFPALFSRFASARTVSEARRGGIGAGALVLVLSFSPLLVPPTSQATAGFFTLSALYTGAAAGVALTVAALLVFTVARLLIGLRSGLEAGPRRGGEAPASRRLVGTRLLLLLMVVVAAATPWLGFAVEERPGLFAGQALLWAWAIAAAGGLPAVLFRGVRLPVPPGATAAGMAAGLAFAGLHLSGVPLPLVRYPAAAAGPLGALIGIIVVAGWSIVSAMHRTAMAPRAPAVAGLAPEKKAVPSTAP